MAAHHAWPFPPVIGWYLMHSLNVAAPYTTNPIKRVETEIHTVQCILLVIAVL